MRIEHRSAEAHVDEHWALGATPFTGVPRRL
jgi:hypothetical protein